MSQDVAESKIINALKKLLGKLMEDSPTRYTKHRDKFCLRKSLRHRLLKGFVTLPTLFSHSSLPLALDRDRIMNELSRSDESGPLHPLKEIK